MKNCSDYEVHLTALALGELEGQMRSEVESHLETCDACLASLAQTRSLGRALSMTFATESMGMPRKALPTRAPRGWSLVSKAAVILVTTGCAVAALQVASTSKAPPTPELALVPQEATTSTPSTEPHHVVKEIELKYQVGEVQEEVLPNEPAVVVKKMDETKPDPVRVTLPELKDAPEDLTLDFRASLSPEQDTAKSGDQYGCQKVRESSCLPLPQPEEGGCRPLPPRRLPHVDATPAGETYADVVDNNFRDPRRNPLSTFGLDVDTASYSNIRRFIMNGQEPPVEAVRVEELINYFDYANPQPKEGSLGVHFDMAACPWNAQHRLLRVGVKARDIDKGEVSGVNLVFLIDVSGSMQAANKLPLVKQSLEHLVYSLKGDDRVGIVVYASDSRVHLPSTPVSERGTLLQSIGALRSGGSTNGGAGIQLAYGMAREHFIKGGVNRVILASDGDFNVGITDRKQLEGLIQKEAEGGVFLTALGFGMGNLKDATLEMLADRGNGNYAYIDTLAEATKFLGEEGVGNLVTVAKDAKIQVEFNPGKVAAYRLIGYENRALAAREFNDDRKDAGDVGAGHEVTVLYEIVPAGMAVPSLGGVDELKYQRAPEEPAPDRINPVVVSDSPEWLTLKLRYKDPESAASQLSSFTFAPGAAPGVPSPALCQAASVAAFGMLLRHSPHAGQVTFKTVTDLAEVALEHAGSQKERERRIEYLTLVRRAAELRTQGRCFAWVPMEE